MNENEKSIEAAKWLVVGFSKCWSMAMLRHHLDERNISIEQPFFPHHLWGWGKNTPVRGFVASNYPKLADFLDKSSIEKQLKVAEQIVKLICKTDHNNSVLSKEDVRENYKIKKKYRNKAVGHALITEQRVSNQRGAWNVCK